MSQTYLQYDFSFRVYHEEERMLADVFPAKGSQQHIAASWDPGDWEGHWKTYDVYPGILDCCKKPTDSVVLLLPVTVFRCAFKLAQLDLMRIEWFQGHCYVSWRRRSRAGRKRQKYLIHLLPQYHSIPYHFVHSSQLSIKENLANI